VNKSFFFYAIIIGCILGCFQLLNTYAIATINGTFLFPTYAGGSIILSTALSLLWFRERLHGKQAISLIIGIVAIILMNF
jgi:multidrug transporter EmrE-like cation transporter